MDYAVNGGRCPDAQGKADYGNDGEAGVAAEDPAAEPNVLPEPTGPIRPRTKLSSCKKSHTVGLSEKSKFKPAKASVVGCLRRLGDLSVAALARAIIILWVKNNS